MRSNKSLNNKTCFSPIRAVSFQVRMTEKELCARDLSILDLLFDPSHREKDVNDYKQPVIDEIDVKDGNEEASDEVLKSKKLEVDGVMLTEAGNLNEALMKFNESIQVAANRPSPYNNRAQLYRFMEKDDCKSNSILFH